ncbi:hypothetical protein LguiB_000674 [Lonicera macranthoides]
MWRSRSNSNLLIHNPPSNFPFSSFKDIQNLCSDDIIPHPHPYPHARPSRSPSPNPNPNPSVFHRIRLANSVVRAFSNHPSEPDPLPVPRPVPEPVFPAKSDASPAISENPVKQPETKITIPGAEKRVVVYLTSLRVVRSTFEDCRAVQSILRGFRVTVDERDLSMDSSFLGELDRILGQYERTRITLPRVFIGGRYIGGADEVIMLHETGELKKIVQGLPAAKPGVCEVCGGYRFILCDECDGSHKCFMEGGGFRSCTSCNENGLIRCPSCASEPLQV